jgi:hypothetical protein
MEALAWKPKDKVPSFRFDIFGWPCRPAHCVCMDPVYPVVRLGVLAITHGSTAQVWSWGSGLSQAHSFVDDPWSSGDVT